MIKRNFISTKLAKLKLSKKTPKTATQAAGSK